MTTYKIYYMKDFHEGTLSAYRAESNPKIAQLVLDDVKNTHIYLKDIEAEDLEDVFYQMQGENWSPNGEARELILSKGLHHTSMSVGDIIFNTGLKEYFLVASVGFIGMDGQEA